MQPPPTAAPTPIALSTNASITLEFEVGMTSVHPAATLQNDAAFMKGLKDAAVVFLGLSENATDRVNVTLTDVAIGSAAARRLELHGRRLGALSATYVVLASEADRASMAVSLSHWNTSQVTKVIFGEVSEAAIASNVSTDFYGLTVDEDSIVTAMHVLTGQLAKIPVLVNKGFVIAAPTAAPTSSTNTTEPQTPSPTTRGSTNATLNITSTTTVDPIDVGTGERIDRGVETSGAEGPCSLLLFATILLCLLKPKVA